MNLQSLEQKWSWGMSLARYSIPDPENHWNKVKSVQGEMINSYKYHSDLNEYQRRAISLDFAHQVFQLLKRELSNNYPNPNRPPFDVVIGLPENRNTGYSLPRDLCKILSEIHPWLSDGFASVTKSRPGQVLKSLAKDERPEKVSGLYIVNKEAMPNPRFGILIIDDVFETGSTVGSLCDTLESEFPGIPRFVIALTHLVAAERVLI